MKNIIDQINGYKKELEEIDKELCTLPEGYLINRGIFYWHRFQGKEVGITKNPEMICKLARKKYLLERKEQLENNISLFSSAPEAVNLDTPAELIAKLPQAYQNLPINYFYHPKVLPWINQPQRKNPYPTSEGNYHSKNGVPLRSKSELMIANLLEEYGLPYHYDTVLNFTEQTIYPDFKIKNPYNNKLVIWEHFGALNQPGYEQRMNDKMDTYLTHGYTLENLIYTFEFHVKKEQRLKKIIETTIL